MQLNELNLQLSHRWQETPERDRLLVAYVGDAHVAISRTTAVGTCDKVELAQRVVVKHQE